MIFWYEGKEYNVPTKWLNEQIASKCEKQAPKKPIIRKGCNWCYKCPSCNITLYWTDEPRNHGAKNKYCHECGQKIDWD